MRGCSSIGRVLALHARCTGIKALRLQFLFFAVIGAVPFIERSVFVKFQFC